MGSDCYLSGVDLRRVVPGPLRHPWRWAGVFTALFVVLGALSAVVVGLVAPRGEETLVVEWALEAGCVALAGICFFLFAAMSFLRLARAEQSVATQRRAVVASESRAVAGVLAASVAHDMRNLLLVLSAALDELETEHPASSRLEQARSAANGITGLARRLSRIAERGLSSELHTIDVSEFLAEVVELARLHSLVRACEFSTRIEPGLRLLANEGLLERAVFNLIVNGAEAAGRGGALSLRARLDGEVLEICVEDGGPGVSDEIADRLFEPFFTTRPEGTGLGLLSVKVCADAHRGEIRVDRSDLGGARFCLRLPVFTTPA